MDSAQPSPIFRKSPISARLGDVAAFTTWFLIFLTCYPGWFLDPPFWNKWQVSVRWMLTRSNPRTNWIKCMCLFDPSSHQLEQSQSSAKIPVTNWFTALFNRYFLQFSGSPATLSSAKWAHMVCPWLYIPPSHFYPHDMPMVSLSSGWETLSSSNLRPILEAIWLGIWIPPPMWPCGSTPGGALPSIPRSFR